VLETAKIPPTGTVLWSTFSIIPFMFAQVTTTGDPGWRVLISLQLAELPCMFMLEPHVAPVY
jgi:hypothetical protein